MHGSYELLDPPNFTALRPGSDPARHSQDLGARPLHKHGRASVQVANGANPGFSELWPGDLGEPEPAASSQGAQLLGLIDRIMARRTGTAGKGLLDVVLPAVPNSPSSFQRRRRCGTSADTPLGWFTCATVMAGIDVCGSNIRFEPQWRSGRYPTQLLRAWLESKRPSALRNRLPSFLNRPAGGDKYRVMPRSTCLPSKVVLAGLAGKAQ